MGAKRRRTVFSFMTVDLMARYYWSDHLLPEE
jgi:hypothetical protein